MICIWVQDLHKDSIDSQSLQIRNIASTAQPILKPIGISYARGETIGLDLVFDSADEELSAGVLVEEILTLIPLVSKVLMSISEGMATCVTISSIVYVSRTTSA